MSQDAKNLNKDLYFKSGFYKITKIIDKDLFQVENTYLIKLKKHDPNTQESDFLKTIEGHTVQIAPYERNNRSEIISDVWLGGIHVNKEVFNPEENEYL